MHALQEGAVHPGQQAAPLQEVWRGLLQSLLLQEVPSASPVIQAFEGLHVLL